jgi:hypothetical protein
MGPTVAATPQLPERTAGRLYGAAAALALSAAFTSAFALWNPPLRDLAAHTFRADYFSHYGFALWNGSWYGGEYMLTYSILFPPLAALLSPEFAGVLAAIACAYYFDRIVRDRWGPDARLASLWFAAFGSLALLANGWLPFALGAAFALAALRALQLRRNLLALTAALASALASPVAALLLALVVGAGGLSHGRARLRPVAMVVLGALVPVALLALAFPEGGRFPFWFSAYWPLALTCAAGLYAIRGLQSERELRTVLLAYLTFGTLAWLIPNPVGGNVTRLGSLFAGPVLAAVVMTKPVKAPRAVVLATLALALGWQVVTPIPDTFQSLGDPSTAKAYYQPLERWLTEHGAQRERVEVPYTFNHWETAYLAPQFALARGWFRQADVSRNRLFYDDRLTSESYRRWLYENGVHWVALPSARLDYSAQKEAAIVRSEPPYLRLRAAAGDWRIYSVRKTGPMLQVGGGARGSLTALGPESFTLTVTRPGDFVVRVRPTPYWRLAAGGGCLGRAGEWTLVRAAQPGIFRITTRFSPARAWRAATRSPGKCAVSPVTAY